MSMIRIENLCFAYPGSAESVFENLNLCLDTDWRLGLIGRNGRGKSTLLRLIAGEMEHQGRIICHAESALFPQSVENPLASAGEILASLCPQAEDWQILREFYRLELRKDLLDAPFCRLSGGERTKILLAAMFLDEGRFPLIDEPTNHLDAHGRALVAAYLKGKPGFILASHDRAIPPDKRKRPCSPQALQKAPISIFGMSP